MGWVSVFVHGVDIFEVGRLEGVVVGTGDLEGVVVGTGRLEGVVVGTGGLVVGKGGLEGVVVGKGKLEGCEGEAEGGALEGCKGEGGLDRVGAGSVDGTLDLKIRGPNGGGKGGGLSNTSAPGILDACAIWWPGGDGGGVL